MTTLLRIATPPLFALALLGTPVSAQVAGGIAVGSEAPDAAIVTLDGHEVRLADYIDGKPAIIEFWATWCPLCRRLEPQFTALAEAESDRLQVIRIGVRDNQTLDQQATYVERRGAPGIYLFDRDGAAHSAYQVPYTAFVVVIDADGTIVYTGQGPQQDLAAAVAPVLRDAGR